MDTHTTAAPENASSPRTHRGVRIALGVVLVLVGGVGVHTVLVHAADPAWAHGLGGLVVTGFVMVGLGVFLVVAEPGVTRAGIRLERACGWGGGGVGVVPWVVYGFCAMLVVGALGVFGWVRGFCDEGGAEEGVRVEREERGERGLSLLELMVMILILSILITLLGMGFEKFRENARRGVAQVTIRSLYVAMDGYQLDNGTWPTRAGADDIHITYNPDAEDPAPDVDPVPSPGTLNLLAPYFRFSTGDLDWGGVADGDPCVLLDPWGVPYFYQIFDLASADPAERLAGEWWQERHLSHPVKVYSVGGVENRSETAQPHTAGGGYWVEFRPGEGSGVQYAHELEDM